MRNAVTRRIATSFDVTTGYQAIEYPAELGSALARGGQVMFTLKRTGGTSLTFKIEEKASDLIDFVALTEDNGSSLALLERTVTQANSTYMFTTLAETVKLYIKGGDGNEVLDAWITVGEITSHRQRYSPTATSSTGDVQTVGADAESNTVNALRAASRMYGFNGTTWDRLRTAIGTATSTITGILNVIGLGKYDASSPTLTDGQYYPRRVNINGSALVSLFDLLGGEDLTNNVLGIVNKPMAVSTYSLLRSAIFGTDVDVSAKAAAGNVYSFHFTNINAAVRYGQIFNKASAPAGADVPVFSFPLAAGTANAPADKVVGTDFFGAAGYHLSTGVAYGVSTTNATFTAATTTDHNEHLMYI